MKKIAIIGILFFSFWGNSMGQHASREEAQMVVENFFRDYLSIEELTLYIIDLQKQIDELKSNR